MENPNLTPSKKIQNRAERIVTNCPYDAPAAPLLQSLGWLSIKDLIRKATAMLTYKSLNSLAPQYLTELFTKCSESNGLNLWSSESNLQIPILKTSIGQNAYCYSGGKLWNEFSLEAKLPPSLKSFKKSIIWWYFGILMFHFIMGIF